VTHLVVLSYPLVALIFFALLPFRYAIVATITVGYTMFPADFRIGLQGLPELDRATVPALTALILAAAFAARQQTVQVGRPSLSAVPPVVPLKGWLPSTPLILVGILALVVGRIATIAINSSPLIEGARFSAGMRPWDAVSTVGDVVILLLPFLVARKYLHDDAAHRIILKFLAGFGLAMAALALFEVRMSPQLHTWVYGYFPHSWIQHRRGDGFRPLVFFPHALVLALFLSMATLAMVGWLRLAAERHRTSLLIAIVFMLITIVLAKSAGAIMITFLLLPAAFLLGPKKIVLVASGCAAIVFSIPILVTLGYDPLTPFAEFIRPLAPYRADSLAFRAEQNAIAFQHFERSLMFGWGTYDRWRPSGEFGVRTLVPDAFWLLTIGRFGLVGYIADALVRFLPVVLVLFAFRKTPPSLPIAVLCLMAAAHFLDLVPNSFVTAVIMMLLGAIAGYLDRVRAGVDDPTLSPAMPTVANDGRSSRPAPSGLTGAVQGGAGMSPSSSQGTARRPANRYTRFNPVARRDGASR
jgi:hypothetical protein